MKLILAASPLLIIALGVAGAFAARRGHAKAALAVIAVAFLGATWGISSYDLSPPGTDGDGMLWGMSLVAFVIAVLCVWAGVKRTDAIF